MSENKGVDVSILGREFTIACTEEERPSLLEAVSYLDKKMRDIRDTGKIVGVERIAIMAALNISHELLNTKAGGFDVGDLKRSVTRMHEQIDQIFATKELF